MQVAQKILKRITIVLKRNVVFFLPGDVKTELNHRKLPSSSSKTDALNRSFSPQKTATTTLKTEEKTLPSARTLMKSIYLFFAVHYMVFIF